MGSRKKATTPVATPAKTFTKGEVIATTYFTEIQEVTSLGVKVKDLERKDLNFEIRGEKVLNTSKSASKFTSTKKCTKTELAETLMRSFNVPFTVNFDKLDKTNRTLVGKLIKPEPVMGRSEVFDFEEKVKSPLKQVDHRTIHWLIVDGVKYELKK